MNIGRLFGSILLVPFLALAATSDALAKDKLRIGAAVSWPGYAFFKLAQEKGMLDNYDIEITIFEDPIKGHQELAAGNIDIYHATLDYTPVAIEKGAPVVNVAFTNPSYGVDQVVLAPNVQPSSVKGKKVAAPHSFIGHILVGSWLESVGVNPADVTWVDLNADVAVEPMTKGEVVAAYMYEPFTTKLFDAMEGAKIVADTAQLEYMRTGMYGDSIYMNTNFLKDHRQAALDALKARWQAVKYWNENTEEVNKFFADYLKWPVEDIDFVIGTNGKFFLGGIYIFDFDEAARYCGVIEGEPAFGENGGFKAAVKRTNEWWVKLGVLEKVHDGDKGVDCSLMDDLVKSGFRQELSEKS